MRLMTLSLLVLAALMICIGGCEREATEQVNDPVGPGYIVLGEKSAGCPAMTDSLLNTLDYHTWDGVLWPGVGGIMDVQPPTWPKNCGFSLIVSHEALPAYPPFDPDEPVLFSMSIPKYYEYQNNSCLPLIIRLEPSDVPFQDDIEIHVTWPPVFNGDVPPGPLNLSDWDWHSLVPDDTQPATTVEWASWRETRLRIHFFTDHFSDWGGKPKCDPTQVGCGNSG